MCSSHPDEESDAEEHQTQAVSGTQGGHKRNLSNGASGDSPAARRSKRQKSYVNLKELSSPEASDVEEDIAPKKQSAKSTPKAKKARTPSVKKEPGVKQEEEASDIKAEPETADTVSKTKPAKKGKKTKEEKEAEAMPLAPRTQGLRMFVGAHVSAAKGQFP